MPVLGANLAAARVVAHELDHLSSGVIIPALDLDVGPRFGVVVGRRRSRLLSRASGQLDDASTIVADARESSSPSNSWALIGPVQKGVDELSDNLAEAEPMLRDARTRPPRYRRVLGRDGPRSILVMLQNGAELRTGGGLTGAFAEMRADHGKVEIVDQASSSDFPALDAPITPIPALGHDAVR